MSKASKSRARERRAQAKRSRKMSNRALYQSWAKAGENTKSFRNRKRTKKITRYSQTDKGKHLTLCGNPACTRCFDHYDDMINARQSVKAVA
jgi:hypothetical protein